MPKKRTNYHKRSGNKNYENDNFQHELYHDQDDLQDMTSYQHHDDYYPEYQYELDDDDDDFHDIYDDYDIEDYIEYVRDPDFDQDYDDPGWRYDDQLLYEDIYMLKKQMSVIQTNKKKVTDFLLKYKPTYYQRSKISTNSGIEVCINPHFLLQQLTKQKVIGHKSFVLEVAFVELGQILTQDLFLQRALKQQTINRLKGQKQINCFESLKNCIEKNQIQGQDSKKLKKKIVQPQQILNDFKDQLFNQQKSEIKSILIMLMNAYFGVKYKVQSINQFKRRSIQGAVDNLHIYIRYKAEDQIKTICIDCKALSENLREQKLLRSGADKKETWNNYKVGFINRQIILLLKSCNLKEENLINLQNIYLKEILQVYKQKNHLLNFIRNHLNEGFLDVKRNVINIYKYLLSPGQQFDIENQPFLRGIVKTLQAQALRRLRLKARIKVEKSARIYGILDQFGVLQEKQVYCSVIKPDTNNKVQDVEKRFNISGKVVLTRNPCMHPGDIQIVTCVSDEQIKKRFEKLGRQSNYFKKYSNCVIFPRKGEIPLTSKISGSDLDGDQFFICWDETLRPKYQNKDYIADDEMQKSPNFTDQCGHREMLNFFVEFINNQKLGRLANSHLIHADRNGVGCQQCKKLNELHCLAVDYPKKGYKFQIPRNLFIGQYPHFLEKPYPYRSYKSQSILAKLYDQVNKISLKETFQAQSFLHINKIELKYTKEQYTQAMNILKQYQQKIDIAREYYKIKTEFELYCGSENEHNQRRSVVMLSKIEQQFHKQFLKLESDINFKKQKQLQATKFLSKVSVHGFSLKKKEKIKEFNKILDKWELPKEYIRKALLWYICSIANPTFEDMEKATNNVFKVDNNKQRCGYGLVWLCIPNAMLWLYKMGYFDLKRTKLRNQK